MASTRIRSLIKGVIWELSSPLILLIFTRQWHILVGYVLIRIMLYFLYERLWKHIKWGKY